MPTVANLASWLKQFAPLSLAANWDNVGLLLGDETTSVKRVQTCLTVTPESAREAIEKKAQLIISHHPILFRPVQKITSSNPEGQMILDLARNGVAVYSPHTAFDNAAGGINDILAKRIGLEKVKPLRPHPGQKMCKVVAFMPESDLEAVSKAIFQAGAGNIGEYSECSYRLEGTGTFFGSEDTNPTIGQKGRREEAKEIRLETVCPDSLIPAVLEALVQAHSYEEPAYDVYPLRPKPEGFGEGRMGNLAKPIAVQEFAEKVKTALQAGSVKIVNNGSQLVEKVAVACGAAGEFLTDAIKKRADVFLTGEVRFHDCLRAQQEKVALVLPGHYATERPAVEELALLIQKEWNSLAVWASQSEKDPLMSI